mmetsp:Transcript_17025/g.44850  ORF Transcript_17025/g.44850 Transcript_17025/m.44850 type:complete len:357 (-) Transcript_17025:523-1593(-)
MVEGGREVREAAALNGEPARRVGQARDEPLHEHEGEEQRDDSRGLAGSRVGPERRCDVEAGSHRVVPDVARGRQRFAELARRVERSSGRIECERKRAVVDRRAAVADPASKGAIVGERGWRGGRRGRGGFGAAAVGCDDAGDEEGVGDHRGPGEGLEEGSPHAERVGGEGDLAPLDEEGAEEGGADEDEAEGEGEQRQRGRDGGEAGDEAKVDGEEGHVGVEAQLVVGGPQLGVGEHRAHLDRVVGVVARPDAVVHLGGGALGGRVVDARRAARGEEEAAGGAPLGEARHALGVGQHHDAHQVRERARDHEAGDLGRDLAEVGLVRLVVALGVEEGHVDDREVALRAHEREDLEVA